MTSTPEPGTPPRAAQALPAGPAREPQQAPPDHHTSGSPPASARGKLDKAAAVLPLIREVGPWFYAAVVGLLYVCGFIVVNANLAKVGVLDVQFANATYFTAGLSFALYLLAFYLFAGRAIIFGKTWMAKDMEGHLRSSGGAGWLPVIFAHSFVHLAFFCCFSATVFSAFAFRENPSLWFYGSLAIPFFVLYTMDITNLDVRYPRVNDLVQIVSKLVAIAAFFVGTVKAEAALALFFQYFGFMLVINFVLDKFERWQTTPEHLSFTVLWGFTVLIGAAATYGTTIFGQVNPRLGGARPEVVQLVLKEEAHRVLTAALARESLPPLLEGRLVHQTPSYLYLAIPSRTLRIKADDVVVLVSKAPQESNAIKDLIEGMARPTGGTVKTEPGGSAAAPAGSNSSPHSQPAQATPLSTSPASSQPPGTAKP